jgi:hypothetical protein
MRSLDILRRGERRGEERRGLGRRKRRSPLGLTFASRNKNSKNS